MHLKRRRLDTHALPMLSSDGDTILYPVVISVYLLRSHNALSLSLSFFFSLFCARAHNTQSSGSGSLYRNLKESLGPKGARNAVPKCIIKSYQEISHPTTERGGKDATRNFVGSAIPRNRRRSNKQLFPPLSFRSSSVTHHPNSLSLSLPLPLALVSLSRPFLSLVIFHARLDGAFIVSSERAPHERNVFPVVSRVV